MNLNAIADNFDVSRPAISNHIKILNECGIIRIEQVGRARYCKIEPANLRVVADWVEPFRTLWEQKLDSFENYLNELQSKQKQNGTKVGGTWKYVMPMPDGSEFTSDGVCSVIVEFEKIFYNGWGSAFDRMETFINTVSRK